MASTLFSRTFLLIFLVFACICCCFHSHRTYCDISLIDNAGQTSLSFYRDMTEHFLLKATEINVCYDFKINFSKNFFEH